MRSISFQATALCAASTDPRPYRLQAFHGTHDNYQNNF